MIYISNTLFKNFTYSNYAFHFNKSSEIIFQNTLNTKTVWEIVLCQRKMTSKLVAQIMSSFSLPIQKVSTSEDPESPGMLRDEGQSSRFAEGSVTDILVGDVWLVKGGTALPPVKRRNSFS